MSARMSQRIPASVNPKFEIEIDGALVADALELPLAEFRQLLDERKIARLCERGTGTDAGLFRATFYHQQRRVRLVVDRDGRVIGDIER